MNNEERKANAHRLRNAVMELWHTSPAIHLMSYGITALLQEKHRIGCDRTFIEALMDKELKLAQVQAATQMQQIWEERRTTIEKALARLEELEKEAQELNDLRMVELFASDVTLLRQAITGQIEEPARPAEGETIDGSIVDRSGDSAG